MKKGLFLFFSWMSCMFLSSPLSAGANLTNNKFFPTTTLRQGLRFELENTKPLTVEYVNLLLQLTEHLADLEPDTAFYYASLALDQATAQDYELGVAVADFYLGKLIFGSSVFGESSQYLLRALDKFTDLGHSEGMANSANLLGMVYYFSMQPELAEEYHRMAYDLFNQIGNSSGKAQALGALGHLYEKKGDFKMALKQQEIALELYRDANIEEGMADIYENIGSIYEDIGNHDLALKHFMLALSMNKKLNRPVPEITNYNNIGDSYRKLNQFDSATHYSLLALRLAEKVDNKYQMRSAFKDLSKAYFTMGDYPKSLDYLNRSYDLYEEIYSQESVTQLARLQTMFQIEKKNKEIEVLEKEREIGLVYRYSLASIALLTTLLIIVVMNRQRIKNLKNKEILEERDRTFQAEQKLLEAQLSNARLNENRLNADLEQRSKSLATHTLHLIEKNKLLENIKSSLAASLKLEGAERRLMQKEILGKISDSFNHDQEWTDFRQNFEQVHQSFFNKIQEFPSELSNTETRLCALIKLNLSTQDIAIVLGISIDSLRIARYRLKKKLGLQKEESLKAFIQKL